MKLFSFLFVKILTLYNETLIGIFIGIVSGLSINLLTSSESNMYYDYAIYLSVGSLVFFIFGLEALEKYRIKFETTRKTQLGQRHDLTNNQIDEIVFSDKTNSCFIICYDLTILIALLLLIISIGITKFGENYARNINFSEKQFEQSTVNNKIDSLYKLLDSYVKQKNEIPNCIKKAQ